MIAHGDPDETHGRSVIGAGSTGEAGATSSAGPLGPVDPVSPAIPGAVLRPALGAATMKVVVGFVALIAILAILGWIAAAVRANQVFALDTWATPFFHGFASPGLDAFMGLLTDVGSTLWILPIFAAVLAWLLWKRRFGAALFLAVATGGAVVIDATMKLLLQRARPQVQWAPVLGDYSFPSGHTMNAVVFYVALALILWSVFGRRAGLIALALAGVIAVGVGFSRIYLGVHYLTDVVGGLLAGIAWLLVVGGAFRARPTWWQWGERRTPGRGPTVAPERAAPR